MTTLSNWRSFVFRECTPNISVLLSSIYLLEDTQVWLSIMSSIYDWNITIHYNDVITGAIASQITSLTIVYSMVYSGADQRKHQSSTSLAFVRGIYRGPVNSPHKWPVMRKMCPLMTSSWKIVKCATSWQWANSVRSTLRMKTPLYVLSGSYTKQMPREHLLYIKQMPLEHL